MLTMYYMLDNMLNILHAQNLLRRQILPLVPFSKRQKTKPRKVNILFKGTQIDK